MSFLKHFQLSIAANTNQAWLLPSIQPKLTIANVNLTENCQAKCISCDYWKNTYKNKISQELAVSLIDDIGNLGITSLRFTGGEILLRKDLFKILEKSNSQKFKRITIATNGLLLNRYLSQLNDSAITHVTVSLDGIGKDNDYIRGVEGYYDEVVNVLPKLNKKIKIVSTFTGLLVPRLEELILLCKKNNYQFDINLPDKNPYFFSSQEVSQALIDIWPSKQNVLKGLAILKKHHILPDVILENAKSFLLDSKFQFNHCMVGYVELNIDSQGDVRTGCNVFKPVGNIFSDNIKDIIQSESYHQSLQQMYQLNCPLCTCGYSISVLYQNPVKCLKYYLKRVL